MNRAVLTRLTAFVLVIAGSFGTAYVLGQKLPGNSESKPHTHGSPAASPVPPGFAADGYALVTDAKRYRSSVLALHIVGPNGRQVTDFTETHGSTLHVVLIHPDLSGFQHLHPPIHADGSFDVPLGDPGRWHIVVELQPAGAMAPVVLAMNLDDELALPDVALPAPAGTLTLGDLTVTRHGLDFLVASQDGGAVTGLQPYLGDAAHLIAVHQGDLAYAHLHAASPSAGQTFTFHGPLPPGTYRLFLQFGYRGDVLTGAFTVVQP